MRGRRGVLTDYIAAVRGTMAMRRERGQARIELAFAGAAMVVAFVGFYSVFVQSEKAGSAGEASSMLGVPADDRGLIIGEGDGFVVTGDEDGSSGAGPGTAGVDGAGSADGPGTTGPDGLPVEAPGVGILPSGGTSDDGAPGGGPGAGGGEGGSDSSLPSTSTTEPGTPTTDPGTSAPTTEPDDPGTTPTTAPPANAGVVGAIIDLLGL